MKVKPSSIVYWFRFALAVIAGVICYSLRMQGMGGISTAIILYIISFLVVKHVFKFGESELKGKNKRVMIGIGTYIFVWAFSWILLYTLMPYQLVR